MADGDHIRFEASFNELDAYVAHAREVLDEQVAKAEALGNEALATRLRGLQAQLVSSGATAEEVQRTTAALDEEGAALRHNLDLNLKNLDALRLQAQQQAALTEMNRRAQERPTLIVPRDTRYTSYEQTAGSRSTAQIDAEAAARQRAAARQAEQLALAQAQVAQEKLILDLVHQQGVEEGALRARSVGQAAGAAGGLIPRGTRQDLVAGPPLGSPAAKAGAWTAAEREMVRYQASMGEYIGLSSRMDTSTTAMTANLQRLGIAESQASNELRRHGALTTEFISALARGETTISEVGYQVGATIGKFAGWATAAAATYAALGAVVEFGKGAIDTASGVQQLTRTIDGLDRGAASRAIQGLSKDTNVPIKEASDAIFQMSRTFHDLGDATTAARLALSAYKLDGVAVTETVKAMTAIHQQFRLTASQQVPVFDELANGQQKFNARISEQIPLLQRSASAVKNAGGNLQDFIQLSTIALRTTQLSGSQLGTLFARSAGNFLSPVTTKGQADRSVVTSLGINVNQGYTGILEEALRKSPHLTGRQLQELALAMFGPQLGVRAEGLFTGGPSIQAQVQRELSPGASRGVLGNELQKELHTVREEMHSFTNGLQRLGAAFAQSGVITGFGAALRGVTSGFDGLGSVLNTFGSLPSSVKEAAEALLVFRTAMLFVSRTRFGSALPGITSVPGFRPSEDTLARREIAIGTRAALKSVEDDIARTTAQSLTVGQQQLVAAQRQAELDAEIGNINNASQEQLDRRNAITARIVSLEADGNRLEAERNAQLAVQEGLKRDLVGLTASRFSTRRYDAPDVLAMQARIKGTGLADGSGAAAAGAEGAASEAAVAETAWQQRLTRLQTARSTLSYAFNSSAAKLEEGTSALARNATAAAAYISGSEAALPVVLESEGMLAGFAARIGTFAAALDPVLLGILALPFALGKLHDLDAAMKKADASLGPQQATSLTQLQQQAQRAQRTVGSRPRTLGPNLGGLNPFTESEDSFDQRKSAADALQTLAKSISAARRATFASPVKQVGFSLQELTSETNADVAAFEAHKISKTELVRRLHELSRSVGSSVDVLTAPSAKDANSKITNFASFLKDSLGTALSDTARGAKSFFDALGQLSTKQLTQQVQGYSDRADLYGLSGGDLQKAGQTYLFLAAQYRNSTDQKGLQLVKQAQQAFISAVNKNVQDMLKSAQSAQSFRAENADIGGAVSDINKTKDQVSAWVRLMSEHFRKYPAIIKAVRAAAQQIDAQLNDQLKTAIDQQLQLIKTQSDLRASQIQGFSPEADIARAQVTLGGLQQELAKAQSDHASYETIAGLMTQINNAQEALIKQRVDNARAIMEAQGQLATASIMGSGPAADIARARQDVTNAQNALAFDQAHNAGQAKILQDQAAVDTAMNTLLSQHQQHNQQLHQDLAAFIQSKAALAESQTTDPVRQAQIQLRADIAAAAAISRSDYKTQEEYLTAVNQGKAKVNNDRTSLRDQIVQADLRNLSFEYSVQQIGDQQYIDGLQKILKMKKLTTDQRQQIEQQIFNLKQGAGKTLDLNLGNIKIPSVYEIRRAIGLGQRGELPGAQNTTINHSAVVNVYVNNKGDAHRVGAVLDHHLGTSVRSAMRARGV